MSQFPVVELMIAATASVGILAVQRISRVIKGVASLVVLLLLLVGWYVGTRNARAAFNGCLDEGPAVLSELNARVADDQPLPDVLDEIGVPDACKRWPRGSVLEYQRNGDRFTLSFRDWLVSHTAHEGSREFGSKK